MDVPFIDIHTHRETDPTSLFSYGIHPWTLDGTPSDLTLVETLLKENKLAAIGETGIDLMHKNTLDLQIDCFEKHILLSEKYQKPLIIHNVHASAEILRLHKKHQPQQTWILHGFNGNIKEVRQLTGRGIYLSVGESLFYQKRKIHHSITSIPLEFLFLETDTSEKTIQDVYWEASKLLHISLEQLKQQIFANFARLNLTSWKTGNNGQDCSSETVALRNLGKAMF